MTKGRAASAVELALRSPAAASPTATIRLVVLASKESDSR
jgi:hypothetical protein